MGRADQVVGVPLSAVRYPSPILGGQTLVDVSAATTITAHVTAHTKGAWTELIASTSDHTDWLGIGISAQMVLGATDTRGLLDIAIGASTAEVAIITEIPVGFVGNGMQIMLPIHIPKGSRVSARLQALISADTVGIVVSTFSTGMPKRSPSKLVTLNADTAASTSTTMMTTSNTWTEVTAATTQPFQGLVAVMCGGASSAWAQDNTEVLSVGAGASGAEVLGARSAAVSWTNSESITTVGSNAWPPETFAISSDPVATGSRVVVKITTGGTYKGAIVFGVPYT